MAKKKSIAGEKSSTEKKARVRWPFPRATLEEALKIPYAIKEHNGGNPWEPDEVRKAIGAGTGGNAYFYLTAASRDYGLTIGTSTAEIRSYGGVGGGSREASPYPEWAALYSVSCAWGIFNQSLFAKEASCDST